MKDNDGRKTDSTGTVDVDGSEMRLFETPVNLPERVVVVDGKLGKEIGFVDRDKVVGLLQTDARYDGFEDPVTKQFMLSYNPDVGAKSIALETEDAIRFLNIIETNLDTAMAADDIKQSRLGVSYEYKGRAYVLSIHIRNVKDALPYLLDSIADAARGHDSDELNSPTDRLIELFRARRGG